jgi:hypothetical protein
MLKYNAIWVKTYAPSFSLNLKYLFLDSSVFVSSIPDPWCPVPVYGLELLLLCAVMYFRWLQYTPAQAETCVGSRDILHTAGNMRVGLEKRGGVINRQPRRRRLREGGATAFTWRTVKSTGLQTAHLLYLQSCTYCKTGVRYKTKPSSGETEGENRRIWTRCKGQALPVAGGAIDMIASLPRCPKIKLGLQNRFIVSLKKFKSFTETAYDVT